MSACRFRRFRRSLLVSAFCAARIRCPFSSESESYAGSSSKRELSATAQFGSPSAAELVSFHKRICESLRVAFAVFMNADPEAALRLINEKSELRNIELAAGECHFERLREGRPESIETSSLHLDVLPDLRRIHSHLCSVAYPVLEATRHLATRPPAETASSNTVYQPNLP